MAAALVLPSSITDGTANTAATLMGDLNAIVSWVNTNALQIDGTKVLTGRLSSPDTDPVAANEFARKAYGDSLSATELAAQVAGDKTPPNVGFSASVTNFSIANNVNTGVVFSSKSYDSDNFYTVGNAFATIPLTGIYLVSTTFSVYSGQSIASIWVNSAPVRPCYYGSQFLMRLTASQIFQLVILQVTGASQPFDATLTLRRLSA